MNTSATGGYLDPTDVVAQGDEELERIFSKALGGILGLDAGLVRPAFQRTSAKRPEKDVDWCCFTVSATNEIGLPYMRHNDGVPGSTYFSVHESIEVLAMLYGPNSEALARRLRDGLRIVQNNEALTTEGLKTIDVGQIIRLPEFINQYWVRRHDVSITFRRKVERIYQIQNIEAADIHLFDDTGAVDTVIPVPPKAST